MFQKLMDENNAFYLSEVFSNSRDAEDVSECDICLERQKDSIIIPCFHMCLCNVCANIMRGQYNSRCPICRTPVKSLVNLVVAK